MNKAYILKSRPDGIPVLSNFEQINAIVEPISDGQLLLQGKYYSVDPYMRGRMSDAKSYISPFQLDMPVVGGVVAKVIESRSPEYKIGDWVCGMLKWQQLQLAWATEVRKIDVALAPPSFYLGILGMPGLTAYMGMMKIGKPKPAETVVVSGAGGAVGMAAGQIARIQDCNVIGIAGKKSKLTILKEDLDFSAAYSYADMNKLEEGLQKSAPLGVDIYFDNVGGPISDMVMKYINHGARIIVCGQISLYNNKGATFGPYPQPQLLKNSALMQGFIVSDYQDGFHDATVQLLKWYKDGLLKGIETIVVGFDKLPDTFISLFEGKNTGKMIVEG